MSQNTYQVRWAIYGAVSSSNKSQANDVTVALQNLLSAGTTKLLISNGTQTNPPAGYPYFQDPFPGVTKGFAALVNVNGTDEYFACSENGTIDFSITPTNAQNA